MKKMNKKNGMTERMYTEINCTVCDLGTTTDNCGNHTFDGSESTCFVCNQCDKILKSGKYKTVLEMIKDYEKTVCHEMRMKRQNRRVG